MGSDVLHIIFSLHTPPFSAHMGDGGGKGGGRGWGGGAIYPEGLYRRDIDQIGILVENWHFRWR